MTNKSNEIDNETLDKIAKGILDRNKLVYDRLAKL